MVVWVELEEGSEHKHSVTWRKSYVLRNRTSPVKGNQDGFTLKECMYFLLVFGMRSLEPYPLPSSPLVQKKHDFNFYFV